MHLFDHTAPSWRQYPNLVTGAITYSEDIIQHQLPSWEMILGPRDVLSTAPPLDTIQLPSNVDNIILYLHTWPYEDETLRIDQYSQGIKDRLILITAYKPFKDILISKGYRAVYIPMSVDADFVKRQQLPKDNNRIIYYGNVSNHKRGLFREIKSTCLDLGLELDVISWNTLSGMKITQEEALSIVSTYRYGIGVGRCALEMMALDVKQVIAGRVLGGLITNEEEFERQHEVNMNGRVNTYSADLATCLLNIDKAICITPPILNHADEVIRQLAQYY